ncbi:MAG: hypothetical protein ACR2PI_21720 [Hyphomicrobiaceae bacterium]
MALHFSETAPGVHTTTLTNPKTEKRHNIAIIESCNAWQLFVDGELAARDLPSFKAAIKEAESKVTARRTSIMVRAACTLVLVSVAGASAIGMTKVLAPLLSDDVAVAAVASDTTTPEIAPRFTRVRPTVSKSAVAKGNLSQSKAVEPKTQVKPVAPIESVVVTVLEPLKKLVTPKAKAPSAKAAPPTAKPAQTSKAAEAPSTPAEPVLGLKPIVEPAAKVPTAPSTRIFANTKPPTPVVIDSKPVLAAAPTLPAASTESDDGFTLNETPQLRETPEALPTASDSVSDNVVPPLPAKAPVYAAPLIRSARAPIDPDRLTSILADIEEEAEEPVTRTAVTAPPRRAKIKRNARSKRSTSKSKRRARRTAPRRKLRRNRTVHRQRTARTARAYRLPPPRMICFAHTCRFR